MKKVTDKDGELKSVQRSIADLDREIRELQEKIGQKKGEGSCVCLLPLRS